MNGSQPALAVVLLLGRMPRASRHHHGEGAEVGSRRSHASADRGRKLLSGPSSNPVSR